MEADTLTNKKSNSATITYHQRMFLCALIMEAVHTVDNPKRFSFRPTKIFQAAHFLVGTKCQRWLDILNIDYDYFLAGLIPKLDQVRDSVPEAHIFLPEPRNSHNGRILPRR